MVFGFLNPWYDQTHLASFLLTLLTLIAVFISKHMPTKMWDEIPLPFPNFNGSAVEVWEWLRNFIPHFIMGVITFPFWD